MQYASQNECEASAETQERVQAMFPIYEDPTSQTAMMKQDFANIATRLISLQGRARTAHGKRSLAEALTLLETASMFAVKALHQG
jgi:two-component sensor histidine kinase